MRVQQKPRFPTGDWQLIVSGQKTFALASTTEGSPTSADFTIFNHGSSPLEIAGFPTTAGFAVSLAAPVTLVPGASIVLPVMLDATLAGPLTGSLTIDSNDPDEAEFQVSLTGTVLSFGVDSDSDGLNDAAEFKLATMGFRWDSPDPVLLETLRREGHRAGLVNETQLRDQNSGSPLFKRDEVTRKSLFRLRLEKSTSLSDFIGATVSGVSIDADGRLLVPQPREGAKSFFRFAVEPPIPTP